MEFYFSSVSNSQNPNSSCTGSSSSSLHRRRSKQKGKPGETKRSDGPYTSRSTATMKLSTDPQSVAARERRHRISDRFKILQSMVPGGSKMDTVSMLDEAIEYVKFLKAQIWLHQNMVLFFDHTTSLYDSPADVTLGQSPSGVLVSSLDADYALPTDTYLQGVPPEYASWFGSADQEAMHPRGLIP